MAREEIPSRPRRRLISADLLHPEKIAAGSPLPFAIPRLLILLLPEQSAESPGRFASDAGGT